MRNRTVSGRHRSPSIGHLHLGGGGQQSSSRRTRPRKKPRAPRGFCRAWCGMAALPAQNLPTDPGVSRHSPSAQPGGPASSELHACEATTRRSSQRGRPSNGAVGSRMKYGHPKFKSWSSRRVTGVSAPSCLGFRSTLLSAGSANLAKAKQRRPALTSLQHGGEARREGRSMRISDERSLFMACSGFAHERDLSPEAAARRDIADPRERAPRRPPRGQ